MLHKSIDSARPKRKIALCLEYPILQHGGTEVLVRELIDGFADTYDLVLVSDDEASVVNAPELRGKIVQHLRWTPKASVAAAQALADGLAAAGVELAHFHFGGTFAWDSRQWNLGPIVRIRRKGVPCLATNHGVFGILDGYIGAQRSLVTKLALLPLAWASRLQVIASVSAEVAVSQADYRSLCRRYWPLRGKFRQIYHSRLHETEPPGEGPRDKVILCAGTIGVRKGQPFLAEAFTRLAKRFPDWKLFFVGRPGDDHTVAALQQYVGDSAGRIIWQRECSNEELARWYRRCEIFAMPSLHEGLGLSLQEALFYGCACIASGVGGIYDLVTDGDNGILVPPANAEALAGSLESLLSNERLRSHLQERARPSVLEKGMTVERMLARYRDLYEDILASRQ